MLENVNCKSEQKEKEKKTGRFAELAQQNKQGRKPRARAACDSLTKERPRELQQGAASPCTCKQCARASNMNSGTACSHYKAAFERGCNAPQSVPALQTALSKSHTHDCLHPAWACNPMHRQNNRPSRSLHMQAAPSKQTRARNRLRSPTPQHRHAEEIFSLGNHQPDAKSRTGH